MRKIAFLRGINVSGHHKVPMKELCNLFLKLGFENVSTLLNSGNVIFDSKENNNSELESFISSSLEKHFGFPIPTIVADANDLLKVLAKNPFKKVKVHKDIRLYVSFLKTEPKINLKLPWESEDKTYQILELKDRKIFSFLDLSLTKTTKAMDSLEKLFGKEITTRNWNTIEKIGEKLEN
ncbi:MAG: DUF1697 domain-containing protein [Leptospiraceae bacterium]|nr:DUF1697 domain-containing protein [Leptospiraceae bacterium]